MAISIALRINSSASPSSNCSHAKVALFRLPGGRPEGLPLVPFLNRPFWVLVEVFVTLLYSTPVGGEFSVDFAGLELSFPVNDPGAEAAFLLLPELS